jgi:hypothetical protein
MTPKPIKQCKGIDCCCFVVVNVIVFVVVVVVVVIIIIIIIIILFVQRIDQRTVDAEYVTKIIVLYPGCLK